MPNSVISDTETVAALKQRVLGGKPFSYVRFGDADLLFMDDPEFKGNKRHSKSAPLSRELREAFAIKHDDWLIGCIGGGKAHNKSHQRAMDDLANRITGGEETFYSAVGIMTAYMQRPDEFIDFCKSCFVDRSVAFVAGPGVAGSALVNKVLSVDATIKLTDRNAYRVLDDKYPAILDAAKQHAIMIVALGQAGRVLAKRLWHDHRDIQLIDIGSIVDALARRNLRSWIGRYSHRVDEYEKVWA